jgi:hypothetical protein
MQGALGRYHVRYMILRQPKVEHGDVTVELGTTEVCETV